MSRKKSKPKNSGRINRRQETIDKRSLGSLKYLEYQIHAEQVPQSKENKENRAGVREIRRMFESGQYREYKIEGGISHE